MPKQPKSIADHKREGTYREDRQGDRMDERDWHMGGAPEMPNGFNARQQWVWNQVISNVRPENLATLDSMALIGLCTWWEIWATAESEVATTEGKERWQAVCEMGMAWKHCKELMGKFGMTPADRSKMKKATATGPSDANPLNALAQLASSNSN